MGVLKQAYLEFARQVESASSRPAKGDLVRQAVTSQVGPFTLHADACRERSTH